MSRAREMIIATLVVALALIALDGVLTPDHRVRNLEFFTEMVYSEAQESFSASALLPGGLTQQHLVDGVVIREREHFPYGSTPEEAERAGAELESPFADATAADLERGREVYGVFCIVCHDARGEGRGSVVQRGMLPPPSMHADRALAMRDGMMFHVLTRGQGNMASYEAQISADDRWRVVRWVREIQKGSQ